MRVHAPIESPVAPATRQAVRLLDIEPDLARGVDAAQSAEARRLTVVPLVSVPAGPWDPSVLSSSRPTGAFAALVVSGVIVRECLVGDRDPVAVAWLGAELAVLHGELGVARRLSSFDPATGAVRPLPGTLHPDAVHLGATFGGRLVTVATVTESRDIGQITVLDVLGAGRELRTIGWTRGVLSEDVAFSQDGRELYVTEFPHLHALDLATGARRIVARNVDSIGIS